MLYSRTWSGVMNLISGCVIWPIFCASVMPATIWAIFASIALSCLMALVMCGQSANGADAACT